MNFHNDPIRILIIDDEELITACLKYAFEKAGRYTVDCVFNGADAIESLEEGRYDIIITDLNLPDYKEFELVRAMRKLDGNIPVIVMSACFPDSTRHDIRAQDVFKCFQKPFDIQEVLTGVQEALASPNTDYLPAEL